MTHQIAGWFAWGLGPVAGQDLCTWAVLPAGFLWPNWSRHHAFGDLRMRERTNNCLLTKSGSRK